MEKTRLKYLFNSYYKGAASPAERDEFLAYVENSEHDKQLKKLLDEYWLSLEEPISTASNPVASHMLQEIMQDKQVSQQETVRKSPILMYQSIAAALVIFVLSASIFYYKFTDRGNDEEREIVAKVVNPDSSNRSNKAVLTLADGSEIVLNENQTGKLADQGNTQVFGQAGAILSYLADGTKRESIVHNTLTVPKGGTYQLILPDGTKVWLNSNSSIYFPSQFNGVERTVSLKGEAYFEVAKNKEMPFKVKVDDMEVRVLGTHFNIKAYAEEQSISTTLLEGSVRVSAAGINKLLRPGQASVWNRKGQMEVIQADLDEAIAWKNGWFHFNQADIPQIMRQLARWYDMEIVYAGAIPQGRFSGLVKQTNDINQVLSILNAGGLQFKKVGKQITILPSTM